MSHPCFDEQWAPLVVVNECVYVISETLAVFLKCKSSCFLVAQITFLQFRRLGTVARGMLTLVCVSFRRQFTGVKRLPVWTRLRISWQSISLRSLSGNCFSPVCHCVKNQMQQKLQCGRRDRWFASAEHVLVFSLLCFARGITTPTTAVDNPFGVVEHTVVSYPWYSASQSVFVLSRHKCTATHYLPRTRNSAHQCGSSWNRSNLAAYV